MVVSRFPPRRLFARFRLLSYVIFVEISNELLYDPPRHLVHLIVSGSSADLLRDGVGDPNTNFDDPELVNFHINDEISLLDKRICSRDPLDLAYGDGSHTPSDEDYAKPEDRPEEDDIDLDTYDKLLGTQMIQLRDG